MHKTLVEESYNINMIDKTGTGPDIAANRQYSVYSPTEIIRRVLWGVARPFFRFSPRTFFGWRRFLLRIFGAHIGKQVHIYNTAHIYLPWNLTIGDWSSIGEHALVYNLGRVRIGRKATVSQRAHLCAGTHDYTAPAFSLLKMPIEIGDHAWICTDAFVGPGVTVGEGAVAGARAVVVKDIEPWKVVAGNPAIPIKTRVIQENG